MSKVKFVSFETEVMGRITAGLRRNVQKAAVLWHEQVIRNFTGTRSGKQYRIPGGQKTYTASAPGEAPAVATGTLKGDYSFDIDNDQPIGKVGTEKLYGLYLETGTTNADGSVRMAPRPVLKPAYETKRKEIEAALQERIE
jgi:hypothetical protein